MATCDILYRQNITVAHVFHVFGPPVKSLALGLQQHLGPKKKNLAAPNVAVAPAPVIFGPQNTPRSTEHSDFWPDEAAPNVAVAPAPVIFGPRNTPRSTEHNDFWPDKAAPNVAVAAAPVISGHQNTPRSTGYSVFWPDELYFNAAFLPASPPPLMFF